VARTLDLDPYEQETKIPDVRRASGAVRFLDPNAEPAVDLPDG
jgi:hypothetical protein